MLDFEVQNFSGTFCWSPVYLLRAINWSSLNVFTWVTLAILVFSSLCFSRFSFMCYLGMCLSLEMLHRQVSSAGPRAFIEFQPCLKFLFFFSRSMCPADRHWGRPVYVVYVDSFGACAELLSRDLSTLRLVHLECICYAGSSGLPCSYLTLWFVQPWAPILLSPGTPLSPTHVCNKRLPGLACGLYASGF